MVQYTAERVTVFPHQSVAGSDRRYPWFGAVQPVAVVATAALPALLIGGSSRLGPSLFSGHSLPLFAAVGIWGAVVISTLFFGGSDEPRGLVLLRSVAMGGSAATAPLLSRTASGVWVVPVSITALLAWLTWEQIGAQLSGRLQLLIRAALVFAMFCLGGAIALRSNSDPLRSIAAITVTWTLMAMAELAMGQLEGQPMRTWTGVTQLSLASAPFVVYAAGARNGGPAALYCACVGVGLLIGRVTEQRRAHIQEQSELSRLQLHAELEAIRISQRDQENEARIHDQTAALFTVESVMNLLQRSPADSFGRTGSAIPPLSESAREELLSAARNEVARARRLVTASPLVIEPHDLRQLLEAPVRLMAVHVGNLDINIRPDMRVLADGDALVDAVRNLVFNAIEHGRGRAIKVSAGATYTGYEVIVCDQGPGVPDHRRAAVFQRGVGSHRGGHGLANARASIEQMGGTLELQPSDRGASFRIELQAAPSSPQTVAM